MGSRMEIRNLGYAYEGKKVVDDINLNVKKGEFVGIIGPNGSGKSTILKNAYRSLKPDNGVAMLDGTDIQGISYKKLATKLGVVGQENSVPFDFKVEDIVAMGRSPHKKLFEGDSKKDKAIVASALKKTGMGEMAEKNYLHLSGGEKQRVIIARVLAQETDFLILDEPTNHLDIHYQLSIFDLVKGLGITVLSAIHDLNIAALYCDRIYILKDGRLVASGKPEELFTRDLIKEVYNIDADIMINPITGKANITYLPQSLRVCH
ncbi:MAG: ABC transporter ATP-binding protein [Oscillospiraceae bacterium]